MAIIPQYTIIPIYSNANGWCLTSYGGVEGYVMTSYLLMSDGINTVVPTIAIATPAATPSPTPTSSSSVRPVLTDGQAIIQNDGEAVPLKVLPSVDAPSMLSVPDGSTVTVEDAGDTWSCVTWQEATGYVPTACLTYGSSATVQTVTVRYSNGLLNLRAGASSDSDVLVQLAGGTALTLLERGDTWTHVQYGSLTGWCMTAYLDFGQEQGPVQAWIVTGVNGGVNLRAKPGYDQDVITMLAPGVEVTVTGSEDGWYAITCGTWQGYIASDFITFAEPQPVATATPASTVGGSSVRYVNTASGTLNLRALPDSEADILLKIPRGSALTLIMDQGEWSFVSYEHTMGYVMSSLISTVPPDGVATETASTQTESLYDSTLRSVSGQFAVIMPDEGLPLRMWCKTDAPTICTLEAGSLV